MSSCPGVQLSSVKMSGCLIVRCLNVRCLVARCPVVWLPGDLPAELPVESHCNCHGLKMVQSDEPTNQKAGSYFGIDPEA